VNCLVHRRRLSMPQSKVTVSTVGPSPEIFMTIARMPATIAWSLHSADDHIRKVFVPSTKHTVIELREGLIAALASRENVRTRTIMIAVTLIDGINDSIQDAQKIAEFVNSMLQIAPKIVIDLIPYNDIDVLGFVKPTREKVNAFQHHLRSEGFFCSVRVTRGDEESSACGMLATKRAPKSTMLSSTIM
jgi:23S rRNA (adenine2503-C2)-methyltransferase